MYEINPKHETHSIDRLAWFIGSDDKQQALKSSAMLTDGTCVLCEVVRLNNRVTELLKGNTDEVIRRRAAELAAKWMDTIQTEHAEWSIRNFGEHEWFVPMTGVTEEVGELAHALLKQFQGIRGTHAEHELNAQDAIGDIIIYIMDLCNVKGWNLSKIIQDTWTNVVRKRDWKANAGNGEVGVVSDEVVQGYVPDFVGFLTNRDDRKDPVFKKGDTHA